MKCLMLLSFHALDHFCSSFRSLLLICVLFSTVGFFCFVFFCCIETDVRLHDVTWALSMHVKKLMICFCQSRGCPARHAHLLFTSGTRLHVQPIISLCCQWILEINVYIYSSWVISFQQCRQFCHEPKFSAVIDGRTLPSGDENGHIVSQPCPCCQSINRQYLLKKEMPLTWTRMRVGARPVNVSPIPTKTKNTSLFMDEWAKQKDAASLPVNAPGTYWAHSRSRISPSAGLQTSSRLVKQIVRPGSVHMKQLCWELCRTGGPERSCPLLRCWSRHFVRIQGFCARWQRGAPGAGGVRRRTSLFTFPFTVCWRWFVTRTGMGCFFFF